MSTTYPGTTSRRHAGGAPPYGQRVEGGMLRPDPAEMAVVVRITAMRARGMSLRGIAARLDHDGIPTKRGKRWHPYAVARIANPAVRQTDRERSAARHAQRKTGQHPVPTGKDPQ